MKKCFCFLLFLIGGPQCFAQAELRLTRIEVSAGLFPVHSENHLFVAPFFYFANTSSTSADFTYSMGASFVTLEDLEIGLEIGYQPDYKPELISEDIFLGFSDPDERLQAAMFMPRLRKEWLKTEDDFLQIYSSVSLGVAFIIDGGTETVVYPEPAAHLTVGGISIGNKVRGFLEFGVGTKGLLLAGLSYSP